LANSSCVMNGPPLSAEQRTAKSLERKKHFRWAVRGFLAVSALYSGYILFGPNKEVPPFIVGEEKVRWRQNFRIIKHLPDRLASRGFGYLSGLELPLFARVPLFTTFCKFFRVNENEFDPDLKQYETFRKFFSRKLLYERDLGDQNIISPCDGKVQAFGKLKENSILTVKGLDFLSSGFLGFDPEPFNENNDLFYAIFYLSPGTYHRFHSPANIQMEKIRHFPGNLYSVQDYWLRNIFGLLSIQERVVVSGKYDENKFFAFAPVGAIGVGSIKINLDMSLQTSVALHDPDAKMWGHEEPKCLQPYGSHDVKCPFTRSYDWSYLQPLGVEKGDELGRFENGSSIVLIFEADKSYEFDLKVDQKIEYGMNMGKYV